MNLYVVLSEEISASTDWQLEDGSSPHENYRIHDLVVARNRSQARWLAWQADRSADRDPRAMPMFSVRLVEKDVSGEARIASSEYAGPENELMWIPPKERAQYLAEKEACEQGEALCVLGGITLIDFWGNGGRAWTLQPAEITPDEFASRIDKLFAEEDSVEAHAQSDKLMCELLMALGYGAGVKTFNARHKRY
jgi:hypothetical protein